MFRMEREKELGQNICEPSLTSCVMGLCWLGMFALLRMHSAMAGLPFEAVELWLLWAKNVEGTWLENMSLEMYWSQKDKTIINDTRGCSSCGNVSWRQ